jgi:hypothetical protein
MNINSAFPSTYIKASDLEGMAVAVTIEDVKVEEVGRNKDTKPVAYFTGKKKGLVLNRTNSKKIAEIAGSQDTEDWVGVEIAIYPTETEFGGETVDCIRVKPVSRPTRKAKAKANGAAPPDLPTDAPTGGGGPDDDIPFSRMGS